MPAVTWFGFPLRSHTVTSLPVVSALVRAGADVTFHTTPRYRSMVESAGARFAGYPPLCDTLEQARELRAHVRDVVAVANAVVPGLVDALPPPDLVVFDASALWGRVAAQRLGVPTAASVTTFVFTKSMLQLIGRPAWMSDEYIDALATAGDLKIVYTSPLFQPAGRFLDQSHLFVGPLLEHRPHDGARVAPDGPRPLAYVSLGTVYNDDVALLMRIGEWLSSAGWQVVVSLGASGAAVDGGWAPRVRVFPFVDQPAALAHASLVVSHGGLNTVTEALARAIPLIVVPHDVDQHVVARRAADLGAAIAIDPAAMTAEAFAAALRRIETERPAFEKAAAAIGRSFAETMPLDAAVQRLLDLAAAKARRP